MGLSEPGFSTWLILNEKSVDWLLATMLVAFMSLLDLVQLMVGLLLEEQAELAASKVELLPESCQEVGNLSNA